MPNRLNLDDGMSIGDPGDARIRGGIGNSGGGATAGVLGTTITSPGTGIGGAIGSITQPSPTPTVTPPTTVTRPPASTGTPATTTSSPALTGPNWNAYLTANPDVLSEYNAHVNHSQFPTAESYAQWHYQTYGQGEGRALPTYDQPATNPGTPSTPSTPANPGTPSTPSTPSTPAAPTTPATPAVPAEPPVSGFTNGTYSPQNDSVVDAVNRVASSGSPLMTRAAGIGAAVANSRGLQNSSIAAQSAQKAALDAAVPIASQEAQQAHQKNLQFMQGSSRPTSSGSRTRTSPHRAAAERHAKDHRDAAARGASQPAAFAQALLAASQSYSANVSAIMSNPDLKASSRQSALNAAASQRNADYNMIQRVYGVSLGGSNGLTWTGQLMLRTAKPADAGRIVDLLAETHARSRYAALPFDRALHPQASSPRRSSATWATTTAAAWSWSRSSTSGSRRSSSARSAAST
jgi:hypothetical protein